MYILRTPVYGLNMQHFFVNVKSQIPHPDTKHGAGIYFFIDKQSVNNIERNRKNTAAFAQRRTPRSEPAKKKTPAGDLPIAKFQLAVYPVRNLQSASGALADCKFLVCRRQIENLPSASVPLAIGKIHV